MGSGPVLLRKPIFCGFSGGGGRSRLPAPPPSGSAHVKQCHFKIIKKMSFICPHVLFCTRYTMSVPIMKIMALAVISFISGLTGSYAFNISSFNVCTFFYQHLDIAIFDFIIVCQGLYTINRRISLPFPF